MARGRERGRPGPDPEAWLVPCVGDAGANSSFLRKALRHPANSRATTNPLATQAVQAIAALSNKVCSLTPHVVSHRDSATHPGDRILA